MCAILGHKIGVLADPSESSPSSLSHGGVSHLGTASVGPPWLSDRGNPAAVATTAPSGDDGGFGVRALAVKRHTLDIYGTELYLATNRRDWATLRRRLTFLDKRAESAGLASFATFVPNDGSVTQSHLAIWIDKAAHKTNLDLIETASHEALHGATALFDWIGHEVKASDEPSAYLVGWLTRWIVEGVQA